MATTGTPGQVIDASGAHVDFKGGWDGHADSGRYLILVEGLGGDRDRGEQAAEDDRRIDRLAPFRIPVIVVEVEPQREHQHHHLAQPEERRHRAAKQ